MSWKHIVLLIGFVSALVQSQVIQKGNCPSNIKVKQNFEPSEYLGKWYEYAKYPFIFEFGGKCIIAEYGNSGNGKISVTNTQNGIITGQKYSIQGTATQIEPAKFNVQFPIVPINMPTTSNYWVLDTDYLNYAVVYSCIDLFAANGKIVWILTRQRNPPAKVINQAKNVITRNGLSLQFLTITNQQNCPAA